MSRSGANAPRLATESAEIGTWDFVPATGELRWSDRCKAAFICGMEAASRVPSASNTRWVLYRLP